MPQAPGPLTVRYYGAPGGNASWYYWVQTVYPGGYTALSPYGVVNQSQPSLNPTMFNVVSWTPVVGATGYIVWRTPTSTPPTTGPYLLAQIDASSASVTDNGVNWQITIGTVVVTVISGNQTPWTQNIDGAGYQLSNASAIGIGRVPQSGFPLDITGLPDPNIRVQSTALKSTAGALGQYIIQSGDLTGALVSQIILWGDPLGTNRRLAINCSEAGGGYDNVTLCEGSSGNVGIGLTSPLYRLALAGDSTPDSILHLSYDGTDNGGYLGPGGPNGLVLGAGIAYRSGWVAKNASGMMLNMFSNNLTFYNFTGATVGGAPALNAAVAISGSNLGIGVSSPAHLLQLSVDDAAKPGTNTWTIASDIRLKENVRPFTEGLSTLTKVEPIRYRYNGQAGLPEIEGVGIDARAHKDVIPDCISTFRGKLDEEETDLYASNSHALTFMLINAVREIAERLEKLETALKKVS